jgi:endonuclease-3
MQQTAANNWIDHLGRIEPSDDAVGQTPPGLSLQIERTLAILQRLEGRYGMPRRHTTLELLEELIACILSQHTSDVNSLRAYAQLRDRFATWEEVLAAPVADLADSIRCGGLADSKAPRIQAVLRAIQARQGRIALDFLYALPDGEARSYLMSLPGVGPKTAAIVLCFAMMRPVLPVDTHVFRVAWRLGLIEKRIGEARAHDALQAQIVPETAFRFHVAMITHGRQTCKALAPRCTECPLTDLCRTYQEQVTGRSG